ncbi:MAG: thioredoxin [Bacteroidaceae bacterium]|nr:thioredoxin [Bacteroidaceae bacterium]
MEIEFTDQNFAEYVAQDKPILVDFYAVWCGPCKKMAPTVEALAEKYEGQAIIGKLDVDDNPEVTARFGIRNIPTLLFIKNGQVVDKSVGAIPASEVETKLQALL